VRVYPGLASGRPRQRLWDGDSDGVEAFLSFPALVLIPDARPGSGLQRGRSVLESRE